MLPYMAELKQLQEAFIKSCCKHLLYGCPRQSSHAHMHLQVNEFHHAPVDFIFTSPLNDSILPPLRVSGDGVLREFGFTPGRALFDSTMVWLLVALFGTLTYFFLETAGRGGGGPSLWGGLVRWVQAVKKRQRSDSGWESPVSELAEREPEVTGQH